MNATDTRINTILTGLLQQVRRLSPRESYRVSALLQLEEGVSSRVKKLNQEWQQLAVHENNAIKSYQAEQLLDECLKIVRVLQIVANDPVKSSGLTINENSTPQSSQSPAAAPQWDLEQLHQYRKRLEAMFHSTHNPTQRQQLLKRLQRCQQAISETERATRH